MASGHTQKMKNKMKLEIPDYLKVQGYGLKDGKRYVRIALPAKISNDNDIQPKDLLKVTIVGHIKVEREE